MVVESVQHKTKIVVSVSAVPEESVQAAQVVIVGDFTWHIIAPAPNRMHCLLTFAPVPTVACPVIDVTGVKNDEGMAEIIRACTDPKAGVINMDGLLTGMAALGAKITKPEAQPKKVTARELSEARMALKEKRTGRRVKVH